MKQLVKIYNVTPKEYSTIESIKKHVEFCGRLCYNSRDKIDDESYERFYKMLCNKKHMSPLAHGTVYLTIPNTSEWKSKYLEYIPQGIWSRNPWIRVNEDSDHIFITTNLRFIETYQLHDWLQYLTKPCYMHTPRYTFEVLGPISFTREFNRHAYLLNGICEMSTRYCKMEDGDYLACDPDINNKIEIGMDMYGLALLKHKPQDAREILPLGTMSRVVYTAFADDWDEIMTKRSSDAGAIGQHPVCNEIANLINKELEFLKSKQ